MKTTLLLLATLMLITACSNKDHSNSASIYQQENLIAWCIVPFDSTKRGPEARVAMLSELGFTKYAYDYRDEHLPSFPEEIALLKAADIELSSVWIWIDKRAKEGLTADHEFILKTLEESNTQTTLWVGVNLDFYDGLPDAEKLEACVSVLKTLNERARAIGCKVALYNHGDWFGVPENQIAIIKAEGTHSIGIVYNFHHAHDEIDQFSDNLTTMLPYLWTVNLNGMKAEGPKIITIGQGDREQEMMQLILNSGFSGTIGILDHTDAEDTKIVLERNLDGLKELASKLNK